MKNGKRKKKDEEKQKLGEKNWKKKKSSKVNVPSSLISHPFIQLFGSVPLGLVQHVIFYVKFLLSFYPYVFSMLHMCALRGSPHNAAYSAIE